MYVKILLMTLCNAHTYVRTYVYTYICMYILTAYTSNKSFELENSWGTNGAPLTQTC